MRIFLLALFLGGAVGGVIGFFSRKYKVPFWYFIIMASTAGAIVGFLIHQ